MLCKSLFLYFLLNILDISTSKLIDKSTSKLAASLDGDAAFHQGVDLNSVGRYEEAADMFWVSIMRHANVDTPTYNVRIMNNELNI